MHLSPSLRSRSTLFQLCGQGVLKSDIWWHDFPDNEMHKFNRRYVLGRSVNDVTVLETI